MNGVPHLLPQEGNTMEKLPNCKETEAFHYLFLTIKHVSYGSHTTQVTPAAMYGRVNKLRCSEYSYHWTVLYILQNMMQT